MTAWATQPAGGSVRAKMLSTTAKQSTECKWQLHRVGEQSPLPGTEQEACQCGNREHVDRKPVMTTFLRFEFALFMFML